MQRRTDNMQQHKKLFGRHRSVRGFTLIELMVTVMIVAILGAIAIPSYQTYARKTHAAQAQQEIQKLAEQLERHKARNFNYKGFDASYLYKNESGKISSRFNDKKQELKLPLDNPIVRYTLSIVDKDSNSSLLEDGLGQGWAIKAVSEDPKNYTFLLRSDGVQCKNTAAANVTYKGCGVGSEAW